MPTKVSFSFSMPESPVIHIFKFQGKSFLESLSMQCSLPFWASLKSLNPPMQILTIFRKFPPACFLSLD